ncbi:Hypothetical predicted protein [Mytilus galloprovincialis]|uniref:SRCR domain-containing protein n=1 Tax=Mytilus galloprovincialis TaxID=29158 RepID=A0A8B6HC79_MYTGA|nr:Hypothetical predicted protein [Mytilus galloprovincialis]
MAGYPRAVQAFTGAHFGKANGSVPLDYLHCTGNETNIDNCSSDGWYRTNCYHSQDAGVACLSSKRSHTVEEVPFSASWYN